MIPALLAANTFAFNKLSSPAKYDGFVDTVGQGAKMALASLAAPDAVLEEDVAKILDAFATPDAKLFVPLTVAIGVPGAVDKNYPGFERFMPRDAFKAAVRRRVRNAPDAALDAVFEAWSKGSGAAAQSACVGSLERWRRADGSWDLAAVDRAMLLGKGVVLGGFVGLATIDIVVFLAAALGVQSIING